MDVYYFEVTTECDQVLNLQYFIPNEYFTIDMWQDALIKDGFIEKSVLITREKDGVNLGYAIEKLKVKSITLRTCRNK